MELTVSDSLFWYIGSEFNIPLGEYYCGVGNGYVRIDAATGQFVLEKGYKNSSGRMARLCTMHLLKHIPALLAKLALEHPELYRKNLANECSYRVDEHRPEYLALEIENLTQERDKCAVYVAESQARLDKWEGSKKESVSSTLLRAPPTCTWTEMFRSKDYLQGLRRELAELEEKLAVLVAERDGAK